MLFVLEDSLVDSPDTFTVDSSDDLSDEFTIYSSDDSSDEFSFDSSREDCLLGLGLSFSASS